MNNVFLVFPNQLFESASDLNQYLKIIIVEHPIFFKHPEFNLKFHKQKLKLHRASMKFYFDYLQQKTSTQILYVDFKDADMQTIFQVLEKNNIKAIETYDPIDKHLEKTLTDTAKKTGLELNFLENPNFLTTQTQIKKFFENRKYNQTSFYTWQRKRLNILMEKVKPIGGKWTFDSENRKKLPNEGISIPQPVNFLENKFSKEAEEYVKKNFSDHPGELNGDIQYPINHEQAKDLLEDFIQNKLENFGSYQDAITQKNEPLLFHSALSSSINLGLLNPDYVVDRVLQVKINEKNINSIEGFIRQIIGWREFMRAVYVLEGEKIRESNFFGHKNKLGKDFWNGKTGFAPVDDCIKKANKNAYLHHIERLMIIGNYMLLKKTNPNEAYRWFMEMFIDAYDWVMVPNVYCMSQFAAGGLITTKPYFSGSNYIHKMSDYKKGDWSPKWDKLFWDFIEDNLEFFRSNPRMRVLTRRFD